MSDHESAFLKALIMDEDDENIRLIYADWLDEQGRHEESDRQRKWNQARDREWLNRFRCHENIQSSIQLYWKEFWENFSIVTGLTCTVDDYDVDRDEDDWYSCPSC